MIVASAGLTSEKDALLREIFLDVFMKISRREREPELKVTFYPFAGLNHTIRIRNHAVLVRISDVLMDAPPEVYRALANILVARLFKRRPGLEQQTLYRQYAYQPAVLKEADAARRERGRKNLTGSAGRFHDLDQIFTELNKLYFEDRLPKPRLSWSIRRTKRILGHHDSVHDAIVISRTLDGKSVPRFVVEYVLYHEMLHIRHQTSVRGGRRSFHPREFRADESRFPDFERAMDWLERSLVRR